MLRTSLCRANQRRDAHRLPPPAQGDACATVAVTNSREFRRRLATRWNAVTSAGIHIGDKISVSINIGNSIVFTYISFAKRIASCVSMNAARRCAILAR
jgi:hypothetical protein